MIVPAVDAVCISCCCCCSILADLDEACILADAVAGASSPLLLLLLLLPALIRGSRERGGIRWEIRSWWQERKRLYSGSASGGGRVRSRERGAGIDLLTGFSDKVRIECDLREHSGDPAYITLWSRRPPDHDGIRVRSQTWIIYQGLQSPPQVSWHTGNVEIQTHSSLEIQPKRHTSARKYMQGSGNTLIQGILVDHAPFVT